MQKLEKDDNQNLQDQLLTPAKEPRKGTLGSSKFPLESLLESIMSSTLLAEKKNLEIELFSQLSTFTTRKIYEKRKGIKSTQDNLEKMIDKMKSLINIKISESDP